MIELVAAFILSAAPGDLARIEAELAKVDRAVEETEGLIARTPTADYLPELRFRLCELYVQKSRLVYHQQAAKRDGDERAPLSAPEVRLLKEKAVALYARLLKESPDYAGADRARFFMAHELRELGKVDEMLATLSELSKKHPKSPLAKEAELIQGDHFFEAADLAEAERHYKVAQHAPPGHTSAMARYKLGWIRVNQGDHEGAFDFFSSVVKMKKPEGPEAQKVLDVRREALVDLAFSYVEVKSPRRVLQYFERLADSSAAYALVLEKLASRYTVKQQPEHAVSALRRLLSLRTEPEHDVERVGLLYDALIQAGAKATPKAVDVGYVVRAAAGVRRDYAMAAEAKKKELASLEEMARDLATRLHQASQKRSDRRLAAEAAQAYAEYLSLFRPTARVVEMMRNRADASFAAREYPEAARQFEALAARLDGVDPAQEEAALWGALVAHKASVAPAEFDHRSRFEAVDARAAIKRLGVAFLERFPKNANRAEVEFNVARAHFDDGEYRQAAARFRAFVLEHPEHKDAVVAGHLTLDAYYRLHDDTRLLDTGRSFLAAALPGSFKADVKRVMADVEAEAMANLALAAAEKTGDVVAGLEQAAEAATDEATGARALAAAVLAAREKGDFEKERELGLRLLETYPQAKEAKGMHVELARRASETARFVEAAEWYEKAGELAAAGQLHFALGDAARGARLLTQVAERARGKDSAEQYAALAELLLKADSAEAALDAARKALKRDPSIASAAAVVAQLSGASAASLWEKLASGTGDSAAKGAWYATEPEFQSFKKLGSTELDDKVQAWQGLVPRYVRIASMGSPEWAVASLWRVGLGYQELAEAAVASAGDADADAVEQQVAPLKERASEAFQTCVQRADEMGVFTDAVVGCRAQSDQARATWARASRPEASELPKRLQGNVDRVKDAPSLTALATAFLERGNPRSARLAFLRALEADKAHAPALTGLGWALLQLGEATEAGRAYTSALASDPTYALARGNLAALRCRFGDAAGARADLEKVPDTGLLTGPTSDPEWQRCLSTVSRR